MPQTPRRRPRIGWTLVEVIVVLAIGAGVAVLASATVWREQRSARAFAEIRAVRADLRDAGSVLAQEFRGASLADTVRFAGDTAIELFVPIASALTCARSSGARLLLAPIPPDERIRVASLTPDTGDVVWIWRADSVIPPGRWQREQIAAYSAQAPDLCEEWPAAGNIGAVTLRTTSDTIDAGAPVQFVRRVRYNIYRASDGAWYLGYRRCDALGPSRCQAVQPVAGPYRARVGGVPGIEFRYFDAAGVPGAGPGDIARIELVVRSDVAEMERRAPGRSALDDSLAMTVTVRNAF